MTSLQELREHFDRLLEMPEDERQRSLRDLPEPLRVELADMLDIDADAGAQTGGLTGGLTSQVLAPVVDQPMPERLGAYSVIRVIGEGGMGIVYEGLQHQPRRSVALKVAQDWLPSEIIAQLPAEAQAMVEVLHPGIPQVYEVFEVDGQPVVAMELVQGAPIEQFAADLTRNQRVDLLIMVCRAVGHAHSRGIVHRDIKPANVLVTADGQPKVLDFGIASVHGVHVGPQGAYTPAYASPEQLAGDVVDARADVYSLGLLIHEVLLGTQLDRAAVGRIKGLPYELAAVVRHAVSANPAHRYADAEELSNDLTAWRRRRPVRALKGRPEAIIRPLVRRFSVPVSLAVLLVGTVLGGVWGGQRWLESRRETHRRERAERVIEQVMAEAPATMLGRAEHLERAAQDQALHHTVALSRAWLTVADDVHNGPREIWRREPFKGQPRAFLAEKAVYHAMIEAPDASLLPARRALLRSALERFDWPGIAAVLSRLPASDRPDVRAQVAYLNSELAPDRLPQSIRPLAQMMSLARPVPGDVRSATDLPSGYLTSEERGVTRWAADGSTVRQWPYPKLKLKGMVDGRVYAHRAGELFSWALDGEPGELAHKARPTRSARCPGVFADADADGVTEFYCGYGHPVRGVYVAEPPDAPMLPLTPGLVTSHMSSAVAFADLVPEVAGLELLVASLGVDLRLYSGAPGEPVLRDVVHGGFSSAVPIRTRDGLRVLVSARGQLQLMSVSAGRLVWERDLSGWKVIKGARAIDLDGDGIDEIVTTVSRELLIGRLTDTGVVWLPLPGLRFAGVSLDVDDDGDLELFVVDLQTNERMYLGVGEPRTRQALVTRRIEAPPTSLTLEYGRMARRLHELFEGGLFEVSLQELVEAENAEIPPELLAWVLDVTEPEEFDGNPAFRRRFVRDLRARLALRLADTGSLDASIVAVMEQVGQRAHPPVDGQTTVEHSFRQGVPSAWRIDDPAALAHDPLTGSLILHLDPKRGPALTLPVRYDGGPAEVEIALLSTESEWDAGPVFHLQLGSWSGKIYRRVQGKTASGSGSVQCQVKGPSSKRKKINPSHAGGGLSVNLRMSIRDGSVRCESSDGGFTVDVETPEPGTEGTLSIQGGFANHTLVQVSGIKLRGLKVLTGPDDEPSLAHLALQGDLEALKAVSERMDVQGAVAASQIGLPLRRYLGHLSPSDHSLLLRRDPALWAMLLRGEVGDERFADDWVGAWRLSHTDERLRELHASAAFHGLPMDTSNQRLINELRARALLQSGGAVKARLLIERLRETDRSETAWMLTAKLYLKQDRPELARAALQQMVENSPRPNYVHSRIWRDDELAPLLPERPNWLQDLRPPSAESERPDDGASSDL